MNRWHPPEFKTPPATRVQAPEKPGASGALDMQFRALREVLERAVKACEAAQAEAKTLRETLLCERLKSSEMHTRYKEMQQFHNATTVGEVEALHKENRRLRTALADSCRERAAALEGPTIVSLPAPAPAPAPPPPPHSEEEYGDVTIEPSVLLPRYARNGRSHG